MNDETQATDTLMQRHDEFEALINASDHAELSLCLRLLGMYLGMYKRRFGEIPAEDYARLLQAVNLDGELGQIVESGLKEANAMLEMIQGDTTRRRWQQSPDGQIN